LRRRAGSELIWAVQSPRLRLGVFGLELVQFGPFSGDFVFDLVVFEIGTPGPQARFEQASHPALHPGRSARVLLGREMIGWIGELHPRWQQKYEIPGPVVVFEVEAVHLQRAQVPAYREVPKFPGVSRDLSIIVPESVTIQDIFDDLALHKPGCLEGIQVFDVYRGPGVENGKKSLAFRVLLQDTQKTMTDPEVESAVAQLVERLAGQFGGKLRD
jgi:phenylalanyl-tRNA synthetase beta chain